MNMYQKIIFYTFAIWLSQAFANSRKGRWGAWSAEFLIKKLLFS